jgi:hypothetical protein
VSVRALVLGAVACGGAPAEVAHTPPPPAPCPTGAVTLGGQADVDAVARCTAFDALAIRTGAVLDLAQFHVRTVGGDLVIGPSVGLATVELADLERVDGTVRVVGNNSLARLSLPRLTHAAHVVIEGNVELRLVRMPALAGVPGDLRIDRAESLAMIDAPRLATVGGRFVIASAPTLSVIEVPALGAVGAVEITRTDLGADQIRELEALVRVNSLE